jgi:hypothetical protein
MNKKQTRASALILYYEAAAHLDKFIGQSKSGPVLSAFGNCPIKSEKHKTLVCS